MFLRNFLVDFHRAVQRASQRRVFDHRDAVGLGDFADFAGDQIDALGDADRRITTLPMKFKPFDLPAAHIFKVSGGKIHEIEAMGFMAPYNSKTGWEK